jgi:secreted trypsin-like serine protease
MWWWSGLATARFRFQRPGGLFVLLSRVAAIASVLVLCGLLASPTRSAAAPRIYNGTPVGAVPPWMGFVRILESGGVGGCGGVAISRNVVLTAAHCVVDPHQNAYVKAAQVGVAFGQSDPWGAFTAGTLAVNPVVDYYTPSTYRTLGSGGSVNDVALLRLQAPAAATIGLLPASQSGLLAVGRPAAVIGWGLNEGGSVPHGLQRGEFAIQAYSQCSAIFPGYDPKTMLCAWGNRGQSGCEGDSGGPLVASDASQASYAVGVVSYGDAGCDPSYPNVFSNVATGSLAGFVSRYARRLQQAADSSAPAAKQHVVPVVPVSAPSLSRATAAATARSYAHRHWGLSVYRTTCSRKSSARLSCRVEGTKLGRRGWIGHMTITRTAHGVVVSR